MKKTHEIELKNISGHRIAHLRKISKMTQSELMDKLSKEGIKIQRTDITKLEAGSRGIRDYELLAIAKILRTTPQYLLTGRKNESSDSK